MENASKALIMAGGILIAILVMSLFIYLIVSFGATSDKIHEQNAQTQITQFNAQFTVYQNKDNITVYDIVSVANLARDYNNQTEYDKIDIFLNRKKLTATELKQDEILKIVEDEVTELVGTEGGIIKSLPTYGVNEKGITYYDNGRIKSLTFTK